MRNRLAYAIVFVLVILLGLASRRYPYLFPSVLGKYPGDALWTIMMFLLVGIALPKISSYRLFGLALLISFCVEFSQLIRFDWLVALRQTRLGHLVLGSTFNFGDLLAYTVGASIALGLELALRKRK